MMGEPSPTASIRYLQAAGVSQLGQMFHCRQFLANALHIQIKLIRVAKPHRQRFGNKNRPGLRGYPLRMTWKTKSPAGHLQRYESQILSHPLLEMELP